MVTQLDLNIVLPFCNIEAMHLLGIDMLSLAFVKCKFNKDFKVKIQDKFRKRKYKTSLGSENQTYVPKNNNENREKYLIRNRKWENVCQHM